MTLNEHIKEIKKEFDREFFMQGDRMVSRAGLSYDSVKPQAMSGELKRFIDKALREIATATLAACEVEKREIPLQQHDIPSDWDEAIYTEVATNWRIVGENMAISEWKKKADEYLKTQ